MIGFALLAAVNALLVEVRASDENLLLSCYLRAANLNADGTQKKGEDLWIGPERHLVVQLPFPKGNETSTGDQVTIDDPTRILKGSSINKVESTAPVIKFTAFSDGGYRYLLVIDLSDLEKITSINVLGGLPGKPVNYAFTGRCSPRIVDQSGDQFTSAKKEVSTREVK